ncbi:unnamed protein product [Moneuplotes crassus]|uniref:Uncharacterized protein n=1 Tax=Euplotes crassus TaxID=5936 RepID=A0AAD1U611_EUPCR|nr:unnamed protein product [Moneuplotes crassus]
MFERDFAQIQEHWDFLLQDEKVSPLMSDTLRSDPEVSKMRKYLIEFVLQIGDRLSQRTLTMQIAVNYLDRLFEIGHLELIKKDKHLWAVTALLLASKYDELDQNIPYIQEFGKVSSRAKYTYEEVTKCEAKFLDLLKWDLISICPSYFLSVLLYLCDPANAKPVEKAKKMGLTMSKDKLKQMNKFSEFFMDIAYQSLELQKYKFSIQAIASLIAARKILGIKPMWDKSLESFTKYQYKDCRDCFEKLFSKYEKHFSKSRTKATKKDKENINFLETKSKTKKRIINRGSKRTNDRGKINKLHSLSRIVTSKTKGQNMCKNSSQPMINNFCQRKASYCNYIKGSRIQVTLNNDRSKKNGRCSGASSVCSTTNFSKKRSSADCNIRLKNKMMQSTVTTPSNVMVSKISRNLGTRKLVGNSTSRNLPSNQCKVNRLKVDSNKGMYRGAESQYHTTKVKSSRNRSVSTKLKQFSSSVHSNLRLRDLPKKRFVPKIKANPQRKVLHKKDLNLIHVTLDSSDLNECNFTMTDESENSTYLLSNRPRKVKCISNIKLLDSSRLNQTAKYSFQNRTKCN